MRPWCLQTARGTGPRATTIPEADRPTLPLYHTSDAAQQGSKVPQAVAGKTSLIMQMCHDTGDSILSIMST